MSKKEVKQMSDSILKKVDTRIAEIVVKQSGDKLEKVLSQAEDLMLIEAKDAERALADALEIFKRN